VTPSGTFDRGVFTLSLDFELLWGTLDLFGPEGFREACEIERAEIVDRLLDLFVEFDISATWCVVGHLFLDHCEATAGVKHPEIVPPAHAWCPRGWFADDPCSDESRAPLFYGRTLVDKIRRCEVAQEIGSHSFSHVVFDDPGCSRETAASEIAACVRLAREVGLELRSFVFPRNRVGHLDVLREQGFVCYRGAEPAWYGRRRWPVAARRLGHLADVLLAASPPVVSPQRTASGLWNVPASMIYFPMHGARRLIPISLRVRRARRGLEAAARARGVFHLWLHPTNLAHGTEAMFAGLRQILAEVRSLRRRGVLEVLPMIGVAEKAAEHADRAAAGAMSTCP
jgi:peptidoglycan/xylan/chitin deacetylase (PgdA/CDA1 family)